MARSDGGKKHCHYNFLHPRRSMLNTRHADNQTSATHKLVCFVAGFYNLVCSSISTHGSHLHYTPMIRWSPLPAFFVVSVFQQEKEKRERRRKEKETRKSRARRRFKVLHN